jgi:hypothetical protein
MNTGLLPSFGSVISNLWILRWLCSSALSTDEREHVGSLVGLWLWLSGFNTCGCMRTQDWMPRIHKIPGMVAHVCNPRAPTAKGEGWGAGEFQEAHQPASSAYTLPKKRPHLKQSGRQGPTPKAVIWIPHICCGMHTPTFSNTNIHATHTEKVRKKKKKTDWVFCPFVCRADLEKGFITWIWVSLLKHMQQQSKLGLTVLSCALEETETRRGHNTPLHASSSNWQMKCYKTFKECTLVVTSHVIRNLLNKSLTNVFRKEKDNYHHVRMLGKLWNGWCQLEWTPDSQGWCEPFPCVLLIIILDFAIEKIQK